LIFSRDNTSPGFGNSGLKKHAFSKVYKVWNIWKICKTTLLDSRTDVLYNGSKLRLPIAQFREIITMSVQHLKSRIAQASLVSPNWTPQIQSQKGEMNMAKKRGNNEGTVYKRSDGR
jgi:hypothetical protein